MLYYDPTLERKEVAKVEERSFEVVLTPQAEGGFTVSVPELPDVITEGETKEEALAMAKDAIEGYLESMRSHGFPVPTSEREQVVVHAS